METPERELFRVVDEESGTGESAWLLTFMLVVALILVGAATGIVLFM